MTKIEAGITYFHKYNFKPAGNNNKILAYSIAEECLIDMYKLLNLFQDYQEGKIESDTEMVQQFYNVVGVKIPPNKRRKKLNV